MKVKFCFKINVYVRKLDFSNDVLGICGFYVQKKKLSEMKGSLIWNIIFEADQRKIPDKFY